MASQIQGANCHSAIPPPAPVLSQSDILSIASSVIRSYPSVTSAYLLDSRAKGTARPNDHVDIALLIPNLSFSWSEVGDIGGIQMGLESALMRRVGLSVCPSEEEIKTDRIPINLRCSTVPPPLPNLSQSDVLSIASYVIRSYSSVTSAYLFGSRAKGTARPDSDVDIALFFPSHSGREHEDIGNIQADLENALGRKIDLSMCPPDDFVEKIKTYWVPINL